MLMVSVPLPVSPLKPPIWILYCWPMVAATLKNEVRPQLPPSSLQPRFTEAVPAGQAWLEYIAIAVS